MESNYKTLTEFVQEVERRESKKDDFLAPREQMLMLDDGNTLSLSNNSGFEISDYCHGQIATALGIPKKYYDSMSAIPELRATNVNTWLRHEDGKKFVRTLDGKARAFLSDRFRPIDNFELMKDSILPVIKEFDEMSIKSHSLTDKRMYLQIVFPSINAEIKQGDIVQSGIVITNSEVGAGAVDVKNMIWRLVCSNGMIGTSVFRKYHIGKRFDTENTDIFQDDTIQAELQSYRLRLRDVVKFAITQAQFDKQVQPLIEAVKDEIVKPQATVENVTKRFGLSENDGESILMNMIQDSNINRYGLANGVTYLAHSTDNPDRAYDLEKTGQEIINLSKYDWTQLNVA